MSVRNLPIEIKFILVYILLYFTYTNARTHTHTYIQPCKLLWQFALITQQREQFQGMPLKLFSLMFYNKNIDYNSDFKANTFIFLLYLNMIKTAFHFISMLTLTFPPINKLVFCFFNIFKFNTIRL